MKVVPSEEARYKELDHIHIAKAYSNDIAYCVCCNKLGHTQYDMCMTF